jgi:hypothetical protein
LRFIATIVSLVIAATLLILGIGFKFFSGPTVVSQKIPVATTQSYVVLDYDVLHLHAGSQIVSASGASVNTVAFGQTGDVISWLGGSAYEHVFVNSDTSELQSEVIDASASTAAAPTAAAAQDAAIVSPAGSDMWVNEATRAGGEAALALNIEPGQSVLISSDGVSPAPTTIEVSWPLPKPTFLWMTDDLLMVVGGFFLLLGIGFYMWALAHIRRGQGPRRRGRTPRMPKPPRGPRSIGRSTRTLTTPSRGRRAGGGARAIIAVVISGGLTLGMSACSNTSVVAPTPTPTSTSAVNGDGPSPVVSESQLALILAKLTQVSSAADEKLDATLISSRFAGAALEARLANYAMRKTNAKIAALPSLRATPVQLFLPQATNLWPRSLLVMIQAGEPSGKEQQAPTVALTLTQDTPRSNYKVVYAINLEPKQRVPEVAAASVGAPLIALDTKLLATSPLDLVSNYGDVINKGPKSAFLGLFSESDAFRSLIERERKTQTSSKEVQAAFADVQGATPVAFASTSAGAIVATQMNEVTTFSPLNNRDLKLAGQLKALAGLEISNRAMTATYGMQLLFYVPPVGSTQKIEVLGYSENLTSIKAN